MVKLRPYRTPPSPIGLEPRPANLRKLRFLTWAAYVSAFQADIGNFNKINYLDSHVEVHCTESLPFSSSPSSFDLTTVNLCQDETKTLNIQFPMLNHQV